MRHWDEIIAKVACDYDFQIISIWHKNSLEEIELGTVTCKQILPKFFSVFPEIFQYFFLGVIIRFVAKNEAYALHAHGTSGYGLAALVSGFKYGVTTYGSEIYAASKRGCVYKALINKILTSSTAITSASPKMTDTLKRNFNVEDAKIHEFSLGVSSTFYFSAKESKRVRDKLGVVEGPIWVANRRVAPIYHTLELVQAFIRTRKRTNTGHLLIMEGDADKSYLSDVELLCETCPHITIISGFINQGGLRAFLSAADFAISIPDTDQLSSSILEGAVCGAIPLLRNLSCYDLVKGFSIVFEINDKDSYEEIFLKSSLIYHKGECADLVKKVLAGVEKFKMEFAIPDMLNFYRSIFAVLCPKS